MTDPERREELSIGWADVEMDDGDYEETGLIYYSAVVTGFKKKDDAYDFEDYAKKHLAVAIAEFKKERSK